MVFALFRSENVCRLCPFCSQSGMVFEETTGMYEVNVFVVSIQNEHERKSNIVGVLI